MSHFSKVILICLLHSFYIQRTYATHAAALNLSYECLGNNVYHFTAAFYRDCHGIEGPSSLPLAISSVSCNFVDTVSYAMALAFTTQGTDSISHITGLCPGVSSECVGGTYKGFEQYIFGISITLPFACNDWVVNTHLAYRNGAITNLFDPENQYLYAECHFSNANNLCNNSPIITSIPLAYACVNQPFEYGYGSYDPDGDSLVYSLANPLTGVANGSPIPYASPLLSATYPLYTTSGSVAFNPVTGQMSFTPDPDSIQVAVISILTEEYRDGQKIASTQNDLQLIVSASCAGNAPLISNGISNLSGGILINSHTVKIIPGDSIAFDLVGSDIDIANSLTMTTNLPTVIPAALYSVSGINPDTLHFSWNTTLNDSGLHVFTVHLKDDACPISIQQIYSYVIAAGVSVPTTVINPKIKCIFFFPNPVQDIMSINLGTWADYISIRIYDLQGRTIKLSSSDVKPETSGSTEQSFGQTTSIQLNTKNLSSGFYTLQIINSQTGESGVGRFVKAE